MVMRVYAASRSTRSGTPSQQRKSNWGWVYALGPLLVGLLLFEHRQSFSRSGHMVLQCAIVLVVYGLLTLWLQTNRTAQDAPKPTTKLKFVYVAYTPGVDEAEDKSTSALEDVMPQQVSQGIFLSALPRHDRVSLQDRRN